MRLLSRRGLVAVAPAAIVAASLPAVAGAHSDAELLALGSEMDRVHAACLAFDEIDARYDGSRYERHWQLREAMNRIPAVTVAGLAAKARAAQVALHYDPAAENEGDGAFRDLSCSLIDDLLEISQRGRVHA